MPELMILIVAIAIIFIVFSIILSFIPVGLWITAFSQELGLVYLL